MSDQTELSCVSCDTTFDPAPNGGFCPNCDTPHPDFGHEDEEVEEAGDAAADAESDDEVPALDEGDADGGSPAEAPSYCPDCGKDLTGELGAPADQVSSDVEACPSCGRSVTDESYCPDCGTDIDAVRDTDEETEDTGEPAVADDGEPAEVPDAITLVINGESYTFEDGETFGRRDDGWMQDLVEAAGGSDEVSYVSSEHLEFSIEDDGVYVTDASRNGTSLNGTPLDGGKEKVGDGDTLTLAERAELQVEL